MDTGYQVALITGASSGFGRSIAFRLADQKLKLVLLARREDRLKALAAELSSRTECRVIAADVRDQAAVKAALDALPSGWREIDVLVNNAGLALGLAPADKADWADWEQMIQTNCAALAWLTRQLLPGMVERRRGHVVMLGSIAGEYAYP